MLKTLVFTIAMFLATYRSPSNKNRALEPQRSEPAAWAQTPSSSRRLARDPSSNDTIDSEQPWWKKSEVWLCISAFGTLAVVAWQAIETRRAANMTKDAAVATKEQSIIARATLILQFRPRVQIRTIRMEERGNVPSVVILCVNKGGTNAHIAEGTANLDWLYTHPNKRHVAKGTFMPITLKPGEQHNLHVELVDDALMYRISEDPEYSSKMKLRCEGTIVYSDENGIVRRTGFSRLRNALTGKWDIDDDPEYEYED